MNKEQLKKHDRHTKALWHLEELAKLLDESLADHDLTQAEHDALKQVNEAGVHMAKEKLKNLHG